MFEGAGPVVCVEELGAGFAAFSLPVLPPGMTAVLTNDTANKIVGLLVQHIASFTWTGTKLATADLNKDGRADLVVYRDMGTGNGTDAYRFLSNGTSFHGTLWRALPGLDFRSLTVF